MHDQGVLHAHRRAIAGIDPLHFPRHQAVGHIAKSRSAIGGRRHHPEKTHGPHLVHDLAVKRLITKRLLHPRRQLVGGEGPGRIADHPLVFGKAAFQVERVFPVEFGGAGHVCSNILRCSKKAPIAPKVNSAKCAIHCLVETGFSSIAFAEVPNGLGHENCRPGVCNGSEDFQTHQVLDVTLGRRKSSSAKCSGFRGGCPFLCE